MSVCGEELFGRLCFDGHDTSKELYHPDSVASLRVEKVQAISNLFYRDRLFLGPVFENKLFKEEESTFMRNFLSDLNEGFPGVFCC